MFRYPWRQHIQISVASTTRSVCTKDSEIGCLHRLSSKVGGKSNVQDPNCALKPLTYASLVCCKVLLNMRPSNHIFRRHMPRFTCRKPNAMCRQSRSRNDKMMQIDGAFRRMLSSYHSHDSNGRRYESINMAIQLACVKNTGIRSNSRSNRRARAQQHKKTSQTWCHVQTNQLKSSILKPKTRSKVERPKVWSARNINYPLKGRNKMKDKHTSQVQKAIQMPMLKCHDHVFTRKQMDTVCITQYVKLTSHANKQKRGLQPCEKKK